MKLTKTALLSIIIGVLFLIVILQRCEKPDGTTPVNDTIILTVYDTIHDTVQGKPIYIGGETDTIWQTDPTWVPASKYEDLLKQYIALGERYFKRNDYKTIFEIQYGKITVFDTLKQNELVGTNLISDIIVPEKIITITKTSPPSRQIYVGGGIIGNPDDLVNGGFVGGLYKDRKDRVFGANVIYDDGIKYSVSSYWKIKFKK